MTGTAAGEATAALPDDVGLLQLGALLDVEVMASELARSFDGGARLDGLTVAYVRYRPAEQLVVRYRLRVHGRLREAVALISTVEDLHEIAWNEQLRRRAGRVAAEIGVACAFDYNADLDALIWWLPFDLDLPALAEPAASLRGALTRVGVPSSTLAGEPVLLRYRPRKRATLRLGKHVLKLYASDAAFATARDALEQAPGLRQICTPRGEGCVEAMRLTIQEYLPGQPLDRQSLPPERVGALLRDLHTCAVPSLRRVDAVDALREAARSVAIASAVLPSLAGRLERLLQTLEQTTPDCRELVTSHCDFTTTQLIDCDEGLAIIDLDKLAAAPASVDLASYAAQFVPFDIHDASTIAGLVDRLVHGYGSHPPALSWFLSTALLRKTHMPFRSLRANWRAETETLLTTAEQTLHL